MLQPTAGPPPTISTLLPYGIGVLLIIAILTWIFKQFFGELIKKLGASTFDTLTAITRKRQPLNQRKYQRYRKYVGTAYSKHALGFSPEAVVDIKDVYVPIEYEDDGNRRDAHLGVIQSNRSVIVGNPGAGKSLLLKYSVISWMEDKTSALLTRKFPVFIELYRCNSGEVDLTQLIVDELRRAKLGHARDTERDRDFVENLLNEGKLHIMFDGLDEVVQEKQHQVAMAIRDFSQQYADCQMTVTCRTSTYSGQLSPDFVNILRLGEFDDAGIRKFLDNWLGKARYKEAEDIFTALHANPSILRLARSPLILSMICYLHTEVFSKKGRTLPTSRVAFYDRAIKHLLSRDIDLGRSRTLAIYDTADKLAILQTIALTLQQDSFGTSNRLEIARTKLHKVLQKILPDLNLDRDDVAPLLAEIVNRSQLLIPVDRNSSTYVFRHLTLQEYLAACELATAPEQLLENYERDPIAWRETVKLWCGATAQDCTPIVSTLFERDNESDRLLALECLIEAKRVDDSTADLIINWFVRRLYDDTEDQEEVLLTLATIAADGRPRGRKTLNALIRNVRDKNPPTSIIRALAATGTNAAAETIGTLALENHPARFALTATGEAAIPTLTALSRQGNAWAVDDLAAIGTPLAVEKLVNLIQEDGVIATRAAWHLASAFRHQITESAISNAANINISPDRLRYDWVWHPFSTNPQDMITKVAGRVAYLIAHGNDDLNSVPVSHIDRRLGLPVIGVLGTKKFNLSIDSWARSTSLQELAEKAHHSLKDRGKFKRSYRQLSITSILLHSARWPVVPTGPVEHLFDNVVDRLRIDNQSLIVLHKLEWPVRATLIARIVGSSAESRTWQKLSMSDWLAANRITRDSRNLIRLTTLFCSISAFTLVGLAFTEASNILLEKSQGPSYLAWVLIGAIVATVGSFIAGIVINNSTDEDDDDALLMVVSIVLIVSGLVTVTTIVLTAYRIAAQWVGPVPAIAIFFLDLACTITLVLAIRARTRRENNPLRACLMAAAE